MKPIVVAVSLSIVMCLNAGNASAATSSTKSDMSGMQMDKGMSMPGMPGMQMNQAARMQSMPGMQRNQSSPMPGSSDAKPALRPEGHLEINDIADGGKNLNTYSLQDLQTLATNNNPTLVQARAQTKGEKGAALQAGLWPNPQAGYVGDLMGAPGAGLGEFQGGMIGQDVILGGKLKYSRKKYQARASAAEQEEIAQQWRVRNDVQVAYLHTLAAVARLNLQRELLKNLKDHWLTTNEMHNMGQANQMALRTANIELEVAKTKVLTAQNDVNLAWQELTTVVGIDVPYGNLQGPLDLNVSEIAFDASLKRLMAESPALAQSKEKLRSDEITLQRERRQPIPNVTLCGGAGYDQIDRGAVARAGFNITNIPIWNRNQGTIQQAQADLERQRAEVKLVELNLRRGLAFHFYRYKSAMQYVQAYKSTVIPQSRERYEIALQSYRDTRLEWPDVLDSQHAYVDARIAYIDHIVDYREAAIEINGYLLTGGLIAPPGVTPPGHIDATPQPR